MGAGYCQWGGLTDRNICNILWKHTHCIAIMSVGPTPAAGEAVTDARKESYEIYYDNIWQGPLFRLSIQDDELIY